MAGASPGRNAMMVFRLFELVLVLFVLWVLANVVRATLVKVSNGGGFWGLSNWMTDIERRKAEERAKFEAAVKTETERIVAEQAKKEVKG
jgi:hypothetical protein